MTGEQIALGLVIALGVLSFMWWLFIKLPCDEVSNAVRDAMK